MEPMRNRPGLLLDECEVLGPGHVERRLLFFLRQPGNLVRDEIAEGEHVTLLEVEDCIKPIIAALAVLKREIAKSHAGANEALGGCLAEVPAYPSLSPVLADAVDTPGDCSPEPYGNAISQT